MAVAVAPNQPDLRSLQQSVKLIDLIIDQGRLQGKKMRQTDDVPPKIVVMDIIQGVGASSSASQSWVYRNIERAASINEVQAPVPEHRTPNDDSIEDDNGLMVRRYIEEGHFKKVKLQGRGQRPVWACDGQGALWILSNLKGFQYRKLVQDIHAMKSGCENERIARW